MRPVRFPLSKINRRTWALVPYPEFSRLMNGLRRWNDAHPERKLCYRTRYDLSPVMVEVRLKEAA